MITFYIDEQYINNNTSVIFKENEHEAFDRLKNGEAYYLALDICIYEGNQLISKYHRNFHSKVTMHHFQKFIQKFLEVPTYREPYILESFPPWTDTISYSKATEGNKINQKCLQDIQRLMKTKHPNFNDFMNVKTYGIDGFSRLKIEQLKLLVSETDYNLISNSFEASTDALTALRWASRGLNAELAIRKVKTGLEVKNNLQAK